MLDWLKENKRFIKIRVGYLILLPIIGYPLILGICELLEYIKKHKKILPYEYIKKEYKNRQKD